MLVLGAGGFLGRAIALALVRKGLSVLALGRGAPPVRDPGIEWLQGSIEDTELLHEGIARTAHIVYAASVSTPGTSARDPALEVIGNLLPLARVLECAPAYPRRRLVYLSSGGTVYGDGAARAVETTPLRPRSYYGAGKVAAEALLHACAAGTDWSTTVLRPTNPYGPEQPTARGFAIIPTLFARALDGGTFEIWGDGTAVRDYCYIDDLVDAVNAAVDKVPAERFAVYNVASGCTASVVDLVAACERASARPIRLAFHPPRGIDVQHVAPDATALAAALGWTPRVDLAEGLARTWLWFQSTVRSRR